MKGEQIGTVGNTGSSTAPHLHFQIDNADAPWHLYWPFTTTEANTVGGFYEAINSGLNIDNVYEFTENPLEYIEDYLDPTAFIVEPEELVVSSELSDIVETVDLTTDEVIVEEEEDVYVPPFTAIELNLEKDYMELYDRQTLVVSVVDERGELVRTPSFNAPIEVSVSDSDVIDVFPLEFTKLNLITGETDLVIMANALGESTLSFSFLGETFASVKVIVTSEIKPLASFAIEVPSDFYIGEAQEIAIVALNEDDGRVPTVEVDGTIRLEVAQGEGYFSREVLTNEDFESGIATVSFTAMSMDDVILSVSGGDFGGSSQILSAALFTDVDSEHIYYQAIRYLKTAGIVDGYEDRSFLPEASVSRVEALKLIYAGLGKELISGDSLNFEDTEVNTWYASYVATAQKDGIVQGYPDKTFRPSNEVIRVEFIKMLVGALGIDVDPVVIGNSYEDVHYLEWYAPYAQFIQQTNLDPWNEENLKPSEPMTRGEVAEMIYRVLAIQMNGADEYSRALVLN